MLTYLKRQKSTRNLQSGRLVNIFLCSLQCITPLFTLFGLIYTFTKEPNIKMIIKSFVSVAFVINIDDHFSLTLPENIITNMKDLNQKKVVRLTKDHNSMKELYK